MTAPELRQLVAEAKAAGKCTVVITVKGHRFHEDTEVLPGVRGRVRTRRGGYTEVEVWVSALERVADFLEAPDEVH